MILPAPESEFSLQEEVLAGDQSALQRRPDAFPDRGFVIVAPLIGRVDSPKALLKSQLDQFPCPVLFPGGAIQKARHASSVDLPRPVEHRSSPARMRDKQTVTWSATAQGAGGNR